MALLSPRLRRALLLPALTALVTAAALLWYLLPGLIQAGAVYQLGTTLKLVLPIVARQADDPAALAATIADLARDTDLRITLIAPDGRVTLDSAFPGERVASLENHRERPEVRQALAGERGAAVRTSASTGQDGVYVASTVTDSRGQRFVVRLAEPLANLRGVRNRVLQSLGLAAAAALLAMGLASLWLDRRLFRPLSALIAGAERLAGGSYELQMEGSDEPEVAALARALNRLSARVRNEIKTVEAKSEHLESILSALSDGVLVTDERGRAELANPAFRRLFALRGEVVGRSALEITRQPALHQVVEATLASGGAQRDELELQLPGSVRRSLNLTSASLGKGLGAVVEAKDISEMVRITEMRRDLVANVSHELKTPLAAIRGYAETLLEGALADTRNAESFLARILHMCGRLQALLDDLLTLSRLESPEAVRSRDAVDLEALARHVADLVADFAERQQVTVGVEVEPLPPVTGEREALERMLINLLENAVKYNRPGGRVWLRLRRTSDEAVLEVADTGLGIPASALPRVFERFYRVDRGRARDEGGTGLGLAIVKHAAQIHGGWVEAESEQGQGSTFRVFLPL